MTWKKLDDTLTVADEPLSAFLGWGLTRNVNAYDSDLRRLSTFAFPTTAAGAAKVKWASYQVPRGMVQTVDVGINATQFIFKVFYQTTNAALGGSIYVRHLDSGAQVTVAAAGSGTPVSIEVPFTTTQPLSGLQGFFVGWISDVSGSSVGRVEPVGAVGNQVFCEPATGTPYPFTLATGYYEMYHLLVIDPTVTRPAPASNSLLEYQVCAFRHNTAGDRPPHGVLLIWPELEIQPAILTTSTVTTGAKFDANLYELGRIELYSVTVEVFQAQDSALTAPLAYQQATPINELVNYQNTAMMQFQPDAGILLSTDGFMGCVLTAGTEATFAFFMQPQDTVQTLNVSFSAVTYSGAGSSNPAITLSIKNYTGSTVGTDVVRTNVSVPRLRARTTRSVDVDTSMAMNGVLAGDGNWGMRDAMSYIDARLGTPVTMRWGPNNAGEFREGVAGSADAVYYATITADQDLYIYGFNCRVL
jgi:hypothetical protein